jgi:hypothetical protein
LQKVAFVAQPKCYMQPVFKVINCIVRKSAVVLEDAKSEEQKLKKVPS